MRATLSHQTLTLTLTLMRHYPHLLQHLRHFAKWTPYKPLPKSKHHQKLRAIKTLQSHLQNSYLVSPFPSHGFSANLFNPLKSPLQSDPSAAKIVFVKNSLVSKAFSGTHWEPLGSCLKGMNSLMFVKKEDFVGPALAGVRKAVKEGKMEFHEFTGGVVGGQLYGHKDLEVLESMPSRTEANAMLLGSLFRPSSTLMAVLEGFAADDPEEGVATGAAGDSGVGAEGEAKDAGDSPAQ